MNRVLPAGRLRLLITNIRSSFWFVPALMVVASIALALALGVVEIDQRIGEALRSKWPRLLAADADGARSVLSTIASSMVTVGGVVFSITIVALTLASTQYTSRVLRRFMRDRANQVVLGVFVGAYSYCLVVLRTIGGGSNGEFVPSLGVFVGLALAIIAIGFLIFFIHHIATAIQAEEIARSIAHETLTSIDRLFPAQLGNEAEAPPDPAHHGVGEPTWHPVLATSYGYIQSVQPDELLELARKHQVVIRMERGVGEFLMEGRPIASIAAESPPDPRFTRALNLLYAVDGYRTTDQDAVYGIRQLVDVALKALSPGINDTTTAVICLNHLSLILQRVAGRRIESRYRSEDSRLRVIARGPTFGSMVEVAFGQILENAAGNTSVLSRMLQVLQEVAEVTPSDARRALLAKRIDAIEELGFESAQTGIARGTLEAHIAAARAACATRGEPLRLADAD